MATNEDAQTSNDDFVGHDATHKALLLKVPDYEDSGQNLYTARKDTLAMFGRVSGVRGLGAAVDSPNVNTGDDLLGAFGGFIDDTRLRGTGTSIGGTFNGSGTPPNETAARVSATYSAPGATASTAGTGRNLKATQLIPDYTGWRDHTDGHRITTTRGDKIEIVGGNYTVVSLGRGTGVSSLEMSGGITIASDEAPGNTTSVTWRPLPSNSSESGWKVVEQVVKGNQVERFHGTKREEFYGDKLVSVIGSPSENTVYLTVDPGHNGDPETYVGDTSPYTAAKNVATQGTLETYAFPTKWDLEDDTPPKLQRPDIHSSTWANSIQEYTHVEGTAKEQRHHKGSHHEVNIYDEGHTNEITLGNGEYYQEVWHLLGAGGFFERFEGSFLQMFAGSSTTIGLANRFELYVSTEEQLNLGVLLGLSVGMNIELNFPHKGQIDLYEEKVDIQGTKVKVSEISTHLNDTITRLNAAKTILTENETLLTKSTNAVFQKL